MRRARAFKRCRKCKTSIAVTALSAKVRDSSCSRGYVFSLRIPRMLAGKLLRTLCCLDDYTLFILSARFITSAAKGKRAEQYGLSETDQRRKPADFTPPHHQICFTLVVSNPNIGFVGVGIATPIICMRFAEIKQIHHTTRLTRPSVRPSPSPGPLCS